MSEAGSTTLSHSLLRLLYWNFQISDSRFSCVANYLYVEGPVSCYVLSARIRGYIDEVSWSSLTTPTFRSAYAVCFKSWRAWNLQLYTLPLECRLRINCACTVQMRNTIKLQSCNELLAKILFVKNEVNNCYSLHNLMTINRQLVSLCTFLICLQS